MHALGPWPCGHAACSYAVQHCAARCAMCSCRTSPLSPASALTFPSAERCRAGGRDGNVIEFKHTLGAGKHLFLIDRDRLRLSVRLLLQGTFLRTSCLKPTSTSWPGSCMTGPMSAAWSSWPKPTSPADRVTQHNNYSTTLCQHKGNVPATLFQTLTPVWNKIPGHKKALSQLPYHQNKATRLQYL